MKKKILLTALVLCCVLLLGGCACEHEWLEATCTTPNVCSLCEETEGIPLGHSWLAATCTAPKTCEICSETEGEALGHNWLEATCADPKHCSRCKLEEGEALPHTWQDATTEAPKTCTECKATEGEKIITDPRFKTEDCSRFFGTWAMDYPLTGEELGELQGYIDELPFILYLEFKNDGDMHMYLRPEDEEYLDQVLFDYIMKTVCEELFAEGYTQEEIDVTFLEETGMTLEEYVWEEVDYLNLAEMFGMVSIDYVYYVEHYMMYIGYDWDDEMEIWDYMLADDVLKLFITDEWGDSYVMELSRISKDILSESKDHGTQPGITVSESDSEMVSA